MSLIINYLRNLSNEINHTQMFTNFPLIFYFLNPSKKFPKFSFKMDFNPNFAFKFPPIPEISPIPFRLLIPIPILKFNQTLVSSPQIESCFSQWAPQIPTICRRRAARQLLNCAMQLSCRRTKWPILKPPVIATFFRRHVVFRPASLLAGRNRGAKILKFVEVLRYVNGRWHVITSPPSGLRTNLRELEPAFLAPSVLWW